MKIKNNLGNRTEDLNNFNRILSNIELEKINSLGSIEIIGWINN